MHDAKIKLSPKEMELVTHADWILTKNGIIEKIKMLLGEVQESNIKILSAHIKQLPEELMSSPPKISKGENYNGLPYLILDYPRIFQKNNVLAIRIMFWWGHFFSITLHLSGKYKKENEQRIAGAFELLGKNHFSYCIHENEWEHHFDPSNYLPVYETRKKDFESFILEKSFIKIAHKIPLSQWDNAKEQLSAHFELLVRLLSV